MATTDSVSFRRVVWETANDLVAPIVEKHGLEEYRTAPSSLAAAIASTNVSTTFTKVDQHVSHIMAVADWLMFDE